MGMLVLSLKRPVGVFVLGSDRSVQGFDRDLMVIGQVEDEKSAARLGFVSEPKMSVIRFDLAAKLLQEMLGKIDTVLARKRKPDAVRMQEILMRRFALRRGLRVLGDPGSSFERICRTFRHPHLREVLESYRHRRKKKG